VRTRDQRHGGIPQSFQIIERRFASPWKPQEYLRSCSARRKKNHVARPLAEVSLGLRARPMALAVQTSQAEETRALCAPDRSPWRTLSKRRPARNCREATRIAQASARVAPGSPSIGLAVLVFPFHSLSPSLPTNRPIEHCLQIPLQDSSLHGVMDQVLRVCLQELVQNAQRFLVRRLHQQVCSVVPERRV
jgi:hypothetical protein